MKSKINNIVTYLIIFMASLSCAFFIVSYKGEMFKIPSLTFKSIVLVLVILCLILIFFNLKKNNWKVEYIFLNFMIPIGSFYIICMLPNYPYDEASHSYRTYVVSKGELITKHNSDKTVNMSVPEDLVNSLEVHTYKELVEYMEKETNYDKEVTLSDGQISAATYPFISYLLPAIGMKIGNVLNLNIILSFYLARILVFIGYLILGYLTLKILPIGKLLMLIYMFNPLMIQQSCAITADTLLNSISLMLIAYILKCYFNKKTSDKDIYIILSLGAILTIVKYVYFPLILMALLLLKNVNNKKSKRIIITGIIVLFGLTVATYLFNNNYYNLTMNYTIENNVNSSEQIKFILHNPLKYIFVIINTTITNFGFYFFTTLGRNLGNYTINVPEIVQVIYFCLLFSIPFIEKSSLEFEKKDKKYIYGIVLLVYLLIETGLYLIWTSVGGNIVEGIQGRYFFPMLFLIPITFFSKSNYLKYDNKKRNIIIFIVMAIVTVASMYSVFKYFNW